jgi:hypothetical protein
VTRFQTETQSAIEALLCTHGLGVRFEQVRGEQEDYLRAVVDLPSTQRAEIFIYEDEIGIMVEHGDWTIFECPDFADSESLRNTFLARLEALVERKTDSSTP